ncbi:tetratricopeptide repeat protein [Vibrio europaeus]|uniref:Tetratricopeptide repeat protein n=1 Tax=Vibrio europaeus TaxID=300876 RepID=A0A178JFP4_9VIBR|nr:tetratricopeptide repeat protein [Vibrio europaeus]MDC5707133.1 tetratricopeptide repeat protein [Vibrio europaeus]MDC5712498.1 tetratricopeptide repeat protein [Vibrio europaeus]MDC5717141.1 tetratricopeptide repeat protein [Vibrio europaeus]MDC5721325.1 tetratricopeptide repeat protein [Vibrio europaeus]MDC5726441.1 tetratricopeptide repeat protein [Vibrio europaeus]
MISKKESELLLVHAALQIQYQQPEQAMSLLDALLELSADNWEAKRLLAVACLQTGRYTRSTMLCEELLQVDLKDHEPGLWFCLSQARWKQNNQDGARQAHRRYLQSLNSESNE